MAVYTDWTVGQLVTATALNANLVEERETTTALVADSSTWDDTPEVSAGSVTATLVSGQVYKIWFSGRVSVDVATDLVGLRIREDAGVAGTQLNFGNFCVTNTTANGVGVYLYAQYTAVASGSKIFTLTGQRTTGTGTAHRVRAAANAPAYLVCEKVMD